jgi:hypothetical protein
MRQRAWFKRWRSDDCGAEEIKSSSEGRGSKVLGRIKSLWRRSRRDDRQWDVYERSATQEATSLSHGLF